MQFTLKTVDYALISRIRGHKMNFTYTEKLIREIFQVKTSDFNGRYLGTDKFNVFLVSQGITPKMNAEWTRNFPNASYYSIAKSVCETSFSVTATVTEYDAKLIEERKGAKL